MNDQQYQGMSERDLLIKVVTLVDIIDENVKKQNGRVRNCEIKLENKVDEDEYKKDQEKIWGKIFKISTIIASIAAGLGIGANKIFG